MTPDEKHTPPTPFLHSDVGLHDEFMQFLYQDWAELEKLSGYPHRHLITFRTYNAFFTLGEALLLIEAMTLCVYCSRLMSSAEALMV